VKTIQVYLGKIFGMLLTLLIPFFTGIILGLLILNLAGIVSLDYGRIALFIAASILFIILFLLIGMTVSAIFSQSITSAITLLFIWVLLAFVIPASGNLIAPKLFPVPSKNQVMETVAREYKDIYDTKYKGTRAGRWDGNPFAPWVKLRAQWGEDRMVSRNRIYDEYTKNIINQVEMTKNLTRISPVSTFRFLAEEIAGNGVNRYRTFFTQANAYKNQLYNFVVDKDSEDNESPHFPTVALTMGREGISKKPVDAASIPRFEEKLPGISDNMKQIIFDITILVFLSLVFFSLGYFLVVRYDKR
jgi:ABC-type transport system involved in multi-copper enzyme maturation permease subunit